MQQLSLEVNVPSGTSANHAVYLIRDQTESNCAPFTFYCLEWQKKQKKLKKKTCIPKQIEVQRKYLKLVGKGKGEAGNTNRFLPPVHSTAQLPPTLFLFIQILPGGSDRNGLVNASRGPMSSLLRHILS